jgi:hypothetical protein
MTLIVIWAAISTRSRSLEDSEPFSANQRPDRSFGAKRRVATAAAPARPDVQRWRL